MELKLSKREYKDLVWLIYTAERVFIETRQWQKHDFGKLLRRIYKLGEKFDIDEWRECGSGRIWPITITNTRIPLSQAEIVAHDKFIEETYFKIAAKVVAKEFVSRSKKNIEAGNDKPYAPFVEHYYQTFLQHGFKDLKMKIWHSMPDPDRS